MIREILPSIVTNWLVKPIEIDDVPILNLTLYSDQYSDHELQRVGEELIARLSRLENISRSSIYGGRKREIRVELDPLRMKGFGVSIHDIQLALQGADVSIQAGYFYKKTHDIQSDRPLSFPSVTLAFSKKRGTNAVTVAQDLLDEVEKLKNTIIPDSIYIEVTRNYGKTAQTKVNELLKSLGFAIVSVVILLAFTLGWREACVVALAVPISFSLALFMNYIFGYTINRVTLFALILSLGLVVDDPITNVDNIQRHIKEKVFMPFEATLYAVQEVLPPVIMSTIAIIVCFTPLTFITGMDGSLYGTHGNQCAPDSDLFNDLCPYHCSLGIL